MAPRKLCNLPDGQFTFWMGTGVIITSVIIYLIAPHKDNVYTHKLIILSIISGLVWATGTFAYSLSINKIELTRSTPIKNFSSFLGILLGIQVFREGAEKSLFQILCILFSGIIIVVGALMLSKVGVNSKKHKPLSKKDYLSGILLALWAAIAFSVYTVPMKMAYKGGLSPFDFLFFMGIGIFAGTTLLAVWSGWRPSIGIFMEDITSTGDFISRIGTNRYNKLLAMLSGFGFALGSLGANYAVKFAGVAVTWPITKNSVAAVLFSVFVLKDVDYSSSRGKFWVGVTLSLIGIIIMGMGA